MQISASRCRAMQRSAVMAESVPQLNPVDSCASERGRRYASLVVRGLNDSGEESAAEFLRCDKSTVNRLKNVHLASFCDLLAHLDLKIVPGEMQCYKRADVEAFMHLAKERMAQLESPDQLVWEET
jgi:hypothetical protein